MWLRKIISPKLSFFGRKVTLLDQISEGGYGFVFDAIDQQDNQYVIKKQHIQSNQAQTKFNQQVKLMQQCKQIQGVVKILGSVKQQKENSIECYMLLQKIKGGNLVDLITKKVIQDQLIILLALQLTKTVKMMHDKGIIHRDIKLQNCLLTQNLHIKLCDFGSATNLQIDLSTVSKNCTEMYRPPEMRDVRRRWIVGKKVDVWMMGCTLYALCYNTHPFLQKGRCAVFQGGFTIPKYPKRPQWLKICILNLLTPDPKQRISCEELFICLLQRQAKANDWSSKKIRQYIQDNQW